ncbi:MAG TPA: hypothetical protein VMV46_09760 [Thermoanaerobaculia bacterium]|nr:hypothetical protein [Thermoanaerobaculia bacterium]
MTAVVPALVFAIGIYAAIGLVFAIAFVARGVAVIDPAARGAPLGFRLLILPASAALWPWLAWRWWRRSPPREERNPHRVASRRRGSTR